MGQAREFWAIVAGIATSGLGPLAGDALASLFTNTGPREQWPLLIFVYPFFEMFFAVLIGLPLYWLARHFGLVRWWSATASGTVAGYVIGHMLSANLLPFTMSGLASGLLFFAGWKLAMSTCLPKTDPQ